jgi:hypothetical protein
MIVSHTSMLCELSVAMAPLQSSPLYVVQNWDVEFEKMILTPTVVWD